MRLYQLLESASDSLTKVWEGSHFGSLIRYLEGGNEDNQMLARMLKAGVQKAKSEPERLFSSLKPLIKAARDDFEHSSVYHSALNAVVNGVSEIALKDRELFHRLTAKVSVEELKPLLTNKLKVQLKLMDKKLKRTPDEEQYDEEQELFVFIGRPGFRESPPGSENFKKTLEIENLIKVDGYDAEAHQMVQMMKLRARVQGENSEVYSIRLPAGTIPDRSTMGGKIDDYLIDLINKHKQTVH